MRRYCSAGWVDITSVRCVLLIQNWSHPEHCPQQTVFFKMMLSWKFYTWQHDHLNKRRYPHSTSSCQLTTRDESCKSIWLLHQMSGCCSTVAHHHQTVSVGNAVDSWYWSHFTTCQILLLTTFSWVPLLNTECLAVMSMVVMHSEWDSVVVMIVISIESW